VAVVVLAKCQPKNPAVPEAMAVVLKNPPVRRIPAAERKSPHARRKAAATRKSHAVANVVERKPRLVPIFPSRRWLAAPVTKLSR
jgi:hypothetical protein